MAAVFDVRTSGDSLLNGGMYGIEASVITAAVLCAVSVKMLYHLNKTRELKGYLT